MTAQIFIFIFIVLGQTLSLTAASAISESTSEPCRVVNQVDDGTLTLPDFIYPFGNSQNEVVCLVAGPNSEVLLQPNGSSPQDGQFCVQGLNSELFEVNHTVRPCLPTRVNCNQDQVWISKRDVFSNQSGSFSVTYTGAETISTQVFYGPQGITLSESVPRPPETPIVVTITSESESIMFLMREPSFSATSLLPMVCESMGGNIFQPSRVLEARPIKKVRGCIPAINSGAGGFSVPYIINVSLHSAADIASLTLRQIVVTFGSCEFNSQFTSEPIYVIGGSLDTTSEEFTSTTPIQDTPLTSDSTESTPAPEDLFTTSWDSTSGSSVGTSSSEGNPSAFIIGTIGGVLALLIVGIIFLVCYIFVHKQRSHQAKRDIENFNNQELKVKDGLIGKSPPGDLVDSGIGAGSWRSSVDSRGATPTPATPVIPTGSSTETPATPVTPRGSITDAPATPMTPTVVVSRDVDSSYRHTGTPNMFMGKGRKERGDSCSETESEGSGVELLKRIVDKTDKLTEEMKTLNSNSSSNFDQLKATSDYIAGRVDEINLSL